LDVIRMFAVEGSRLFGNNDKIMLGIEAWRCLVSVVLTV
jgi:hypothetical protein